MKALVTGGYFDDSCEAVIWIVDFATGTADVLTRWTPPTHLRVAGRGFTGGSLALDGTLYVACHAAVARVDVSSGEVTGIIHQPCMNDLHHVHTENGRLYVANTGLGCIDVLDVEGAFLGSHSFLPAWVNHHRQSGRDPRSFECLTRPGWTGETPLFDQRPYTDDGYHDADRTERVFHQCRVPDHLHLNHTTRSGHRLLATSFSTGRLIDVHRLETVWHRPGAYLHDGFVRDKRLWLTSIDGHIFTLDSVSFETIATLSIFETTGCTGWCRGLAVADDGLLIGLTEVRRGRLPPHRWSNARPDGSETSVLMVEPSTGHLLSRVDLTDLERHAKIYSVLPLPHMFDRTVQTTENR